MIVLRRLAELRAVTRGWHREGAVIGLVPTMGALHAGHMSLVDAARAGADRVIATIFVNPMQFNNSEDLAKYPRTEDADVAMLRAAGVDVLYMPAPDQIYPAGFATTVSVAGVSEGLCGAHRPGHFDGVATVVTKLFTQSAADRAWFGEKDFQQLQVIRRLVRDLDLPVEVIGCPTVREADGLALSSRNRRLSAGARAQAPTLYRAMMAAAKDMRAGAVAPALDAAGRAILAGGYDAVDYLEVRSEDGLAPMEVLDRPARVMVAAMIEGVRLIDNIPMAP